jgi:hypothetical protein
MSKKLKKVWAAIFSKEKGSALVIALIVMLVLTLLGLSLLLQSNTEYVIAVNERDSTAALENAEGGLQLAKAVIIEKAIGAPNLTNLLVGPDGTPGTTDDGIISIRQVNPALTNSNQLNDDCSVGSLTCESAISVIEDINLKKYEVFRVGFDRDGSVPSGKSGWDGPRGLVYVRVEDNYDDEPALNDPWSDKDKNIIAHVISRYPIQVGANGVYSGPSLTANLRIAGISTRELTGRFGTVSTQPAIVTEGDMKLKGSIDVCGECGAVHADQTLTIGATDVDICSNATSTATPPVMNDGGTAQIGGTVGSGPFIPVPVANPFHANYVPTPAMFDTTTPGDPELTGYPFLQCSGPAASKYFAFVGDGSHGQIYKAYWKPSAIPPRWEWELIDQLGDGHNTVLDDCGRVVVIDPSIRPPSGTPDTGAGTGIDDGSDNQFYGFTYHDGGGGTPACVAANDASLGPTSTENDYVNAAAELPVGLPAGVLLPATGPPDGIADYNAGFVIGNNHHQWTINGNDVWSPLYNGVLWFWGNLNLSGGPTTLCSTNDTPPCSQALPGGIWRATFISLNNIDAKGNPRYAPFRGQAYYNDQYVLIAGRDIDLGGTPGAGNICPAQCDGAPLVAAGYAGIVLAHEQLEITGNVSVNGLVKSEDAATCANFADTQGAGIGGSGSAQVYYDCVHPPDTGSESVQLLSWEENQ